MRYDYGGPEPLNALANLRLSQSKPGEAAESAVEAFRRLGLCGGYTFFTWKTCSVRARGLSLHLLRMRWYLRWGTMQMIYRELGPISAVWQQPHKIGTLHLVG